MTIHTACRRDVRPPGQGLDGYEVPNMRRARAGILMILWCAAAMAAEHGPPGMKLEHPGDTALSQENSGAWVYKSFPGLTRLYIYDRDGVSVSRCTEGCASAWPPLLATIGETGEKVGDWTIIVRDDGRRQWAYKGHPVYTRFHDLEEDAQSLAAEGFHLLTP
jgi:predicted lipoprotein with Yx(FWY)xxD motif